MLENAKVARRAGADPVIGLLNSHDRGAALEELQAGFERLPASTTPDRTSEDPHASLRVNIEAAKRRAPSILLIDTHIPEWLRKDGIRLDQPWMDIERLLRLGLNVWAALDGSGFSSWIDVAAASPPRRPGLSLL